MKIKHAHTSQACVQLLVEAQVHRIEAERLVEHLALVQRDVLLSREVVLARDVDVLEVHREVV